MVIFLNKIDCVLKFQLTTFLLGIEDYMLPCLNKQLFGIDCPGCGMQRSLLYLIKGEFTEAFHMYPPIFILIPFVLFTILNQFLKFKYSNIIQLSLGIATGATIIANYIIKMTHITH